MNPFHLMGYYGPATFCDREVETEKLINAIDNQRNITLTSLRKMGKTGLIDHVLAHLKKKKSYTIFYIDIFHTIDLADFLDKLGSEIISKEKSFKVKARNLLGKFVQSLSPTVSYDPLSGNPSLSFNFNTHQRKVQTLHEIFNFLSEYSQTNPVVVAIDEFQQITNYPEKNIEALLRGVIQKLNNVNFIFSGSDTTLMSAIFTNTIRPFYQSTQMMHLDSIPDEKYIPFIKKHLKAGGKNIKKAEILYILDETRRHTYYVQYFCNRIYGSDFVNMDMQSLKKVYVDILAENEVFYSLFRDLVSPHQWKLLIALAHETGISAVNSAAFIKKYNLTNASTVRRGIEALLTKQLIYKKENQYFVYDVFFSKWLSMQKY